MLLYIQGEGRYIFRYISFILIETNSGFNNCLSFYICMYTLLQLIWGKCKHSDIWLGSLLVVAYVI